MLYLVELFNFKETIMLAAISSNTLLKLQVPTVFEHYNRHNGIAPGTPVTDLEVKRMKYKHVRKMQTMKEEEQMNYIMRELTGLSQEDLDEVDAEDAAALFEIVFSYMQKYADIAKKAMQNQEKS